MLLRNCSQIHSHSFKTKCCNHLKILSNSLHTFSVWHVSEAVKMIYRKRTSTLKPVLVGPTRLKRLTPRKKNFPCVHFFILSRPCPSWQVSISTMLPLHMLRSCSRRSCSCCCCCCRCHCIWHCCRYSCPLGHKLKKGEKRKLVSVAIIDHVYLAQGPFYEHSYRAMSHKIALLTLSLVISSSTQLNSDFGFAKRLFTVGTVVLSDMQAGFVK